MNVSLGETFSSGTFEVRDASGVLGNATSVTYVITYADGTTTAPAAATSIGTGQYAVDFTTTQIGWHGLTVTATGGVLGSFSRQWNDVFVVQTVRLLVSVDDAVKHLRAQGVITSASDRAQLLWLCQVATDAVERDLGRTLVPTTYTEYHDGGACSLLLIHSPVIAVTSVTERGTALLTDGTTYLLDGANGVLRRGTSTGPLSWLTGTAAIAVTYRAGYTVPPIVARKVALNGVQRMWQQSQQAPLNAYADVTGDTAMFGAAGTLTPLELAAYDALRVPGFA